MVFWERVLGSEGIDPRCPVSDGGDPPYHAVARYIDDELGAVLSVESAALPRLALLRAGKAEECDVELDVHVYLRSPLGGWTDHSGGGTDAHVVQADVTGDACLLGFAMTGVSEHTGQAYAIVNGYRRDDVAVVNVAGTEVTLPPLSDGPFGLFLVRMDPEVWHSAYWPF